MLGVAPGLACLAYSVLSFRTEKFAADPIDCGVEHSTGHSETAPVWKISRSARVHHLVMGVVFGRDPPAVLSLGPPLDPTEPDRSVESVRAVLLSLALGLRAQVVNFDTEEEVRATLSEHYGDEMSVGERGLRKAVRCALSSPLPSKNRRVVLATATALAGAYRVRSEV